MIWDTILGGYFASKFQSIDSVDFIAAGMLRSIKGYLTQQVDSSGALQKLCKFIGSADAKVVLNLALESEKYQKTKHEKPNAGAKGPILVDWKSKESRYTAPQQNSSDSPSQKPKSDTTSKKTDSDSNTTLKLGADPKLVSTKSAEPSRDKEDAKDDRQFSKSISTQSPSKAPTETTVDGPKPHKVTLKAPIVSDIPKEDAEPEVAEKGPKRKQKTADDEEESAPMISEPTTRPRGSQQIVVDKKETDSKPASKEEENLFGDLLKNRTAAKKTVAPPKELVVPGDFLSKVNSKIYSCISELQTEQLKGKSARVDSVLQTLQQLREQLFEQQAASNKQAAAQSSTN